MDIQLSEVRVLELLNLIVLVTVFVWLYLDRRRDRWKTRWFAEQRLGRAWRSSAAVESQLRRIIEESQERFGINLTWAAHEMLVIPIVEVVEQGEKVDFGEVERSVVQLMEEMREEPDLGPTIGRNGRRRRDAISVIRGFSRRYCRIPPFCTPERG
jgi:hypothetical protein